MINVEVDRTANESTANLLRRFTKRVQGAGILPRVRGIRYHSRPVTKLSRKKRTLKRIKKKTEIEGLIKWGKMAERTPYQRRGR